jgi:hypothetical protein
VLELSASTEPRLQLINFYYLQIMKSQEFIKEIEKKPRHHVSSKLTTPISSSFSLRKHIFIWKYCRQKMHEV